MTEMVTSGSMSGEGKRGDGPLGESSNERKCSLQAPPVRTAAAPLLDSTGCGAPAQHPRIQVGCGRGYEAGCSSTRNGPPARLQPTRAIHVTGSAVAGGASVTAGARRHPQKCGPE